jgi:ArsR family transcriptional regulator
MMDTEVALLKALAEPTRLRLAALLARNGETCVCELAEALGAPAFRVSRHLAIMKDRGLVEARRQGTWMHYRLASPRGKLEECLQECFRDCLAEHPSVVADRERLRAHRELTPAAGGRDSAGCVSPAAENAP